MRSTGRIELPRLVIRARTRIVAGRVTGPLPTTRVAVACTAEVDASTLHHNRAVKRRVHRPVGVVGREGPPDQADEVVDVDPGEVLGARADRSAEPELEGREHLGNIADLIPIYTEFNDMPVVSISNSQREPFPSVNWQGTVYHGLPKDCASFHEEPGKYLAFLGRICPEKRVDRAIKTAKKCGLPLKIAAKVDKVDREYYEQYIEPMLDDPLIEYVGEIGEGEKDEFLGNALALMFPIDWPEPFGLAMIEAMACGTPVIARRCGSVPEVLDEGVTGFIVESSDEAFEAVKKIHTLNRATCREVFEKRFTDMRMASDYVTIYEKLIKENLKA